MSAAKTVRALTALAAAAGLGGLLLGCGADLGITPESLPEPAIVPFDAVETCTAAGTATTVTITQTDTRVVRNSPTFNPPDHVDVNGTVDVATDKVILVATAHPDTCPLHQKAEATVEMDGTYNGKLELPGVDDFVVGAIAVDASVTLADVTCDTANDCLDLAGNTANGVSSSLLIRLE